MATGAAPAWRRRDLLGDERIEFRRSLNLSCGGRFAHRRTAGILSPGWRVRGTPVGVVAACRRCCRQRVGVYRSRDLSRHSLRQLAVVGIRVSSGRVAVPARHARCGDHCHRRRGLSDDAQGCARAAPRFAVRDAGCRGHRRCVDADHLGAGAHRRQAISVFSKRRRLRDVRRARLDVGRDGRSDRERKRGSHRPRLAVQGECGRAPRFAGFLSGRGRQSAGLSRRGLLADQARRGCLGRSPSLHARRQSRAAAQADEVTRRAQQRVVRNRQSRAGREILSGFEARVGRVAAGAWAS